MIWSRVVFRASATSSRSETVPLRSSATSSRSSTVMFNRLLRTAYRSFSVSSRSTSPLSRWTCSSSTSICWLRAGNRKSHPYTEADPDTSATSRRTSRTGFTRQRYIALPPPQKRDRERNSPLRRLRVLLASCWIARPLRPPPSSSRIGESKRSRDTGRESPSLSRWFFGARPLPPIPLRDPKDRDGDALRGTVSKVSAGESASSSLWWPRRRASARSSRSTGSLWARSRRGSGVPSEDGGNFGFPPRLLRDLEKIPPMAVGEETFDARRVWLEPFELLLVTLRVLFCFFLVPMMSSGWGYSIDGDSLNKLRCE
mmetsp:Transcript_9925/g.24155  ORF Transcript_9925/g.24155 Transcript_9925/m.24155 type:complete len:314 (+) Transcript_9925:1137-2078(+)